MSAWSIRRSAPRLHAPGRSSKPLILQEADKSAAGVETVMNRRRAVCSRFQRKFLPLLLRRGVRAAMIGEDVCANTDMIAGWLGCSRRTATNLLAWAKREQLLRVVHGGSGGRSVEMRVAVNLGAIADYLVRHFRPGRGLIRSLEGLHNRALWLIRKVGKKPRKTSPPYKKHSLRPLGEGSAAAETQASQPWSDPIRGAGGTRISAAPATDDFFRRYFAPDPASVALNWGGGHG